MDTARYGNGFASSPDWAHAKHLKDKEISGGEGGNRSRHVRACFMEGFRQSAIADIPTDIPAIVSIQWTLASLGRNISEAVFGRRPAVRVRLRQIEIVVHCHSADEPS